MSARFNVTRSSSDSQTHPPFAVHVDSETSKDRDQFTGRGLSRLTEQVWKFFAAREPAGSWTMFTSFKTACRLVFGVLTLLLRHTNW